MLKELETESLRIGIVSNLTMPTPSPVMEILLARFPKYHVFVIL